MTNLPNEPNLSLRVSRFNDILISAATTHVGKSKPSRRSKPWITPHVRAKIRNHNRLCQTIHKTAKSGQTLAVKLPRQSRRLNQRAGGIYLQTRCPTETVLTCGKLSKVSTVLLMLTLQTKLCPTTVERSLILNPKLTFLLITTPGSANSICHNATVTSTNSLRKVSKHDLLTMRAVHQF